jgi:hypothetical protein
VPDTGVPIFNERAARKLRSADDLDEYVRVTNPSVWVVLAAVVVLLAGLLAWAVFGAVTTSVSATGTAVETAAIPQSAKLDVTGQKAVVCFLSADDVVNVDPTDMADVGGQRMKVGGVSPLPTSPEEWDGALGSKYLAKSMFKDDWAYAVVFEGDASQFEEGTPLSVVITTERITPISLLLRNRG